MIDKIVAYIPYEISVEYSNSTPGDQFGTYGDATKIERDLGWKYRINLDDGLKKMIKWYERRLV